MDTVLVLNSCKTGKNALKFIVRTGTSDQFCKRFNGKDVLPNIRDIEDGGSWMIVGGIY